MRQRSPVRPPGRKVTFSWCDYTKKDPPRHAEGPVSASGRHTSAGVPAGGDPLCGRDILSRPPGTRPRSPSAGKGVQRLSGAADAESRPEGSKIQQSAPPTQTRHGCRVHEGPVARHRLKPALHAPNAAPAPTQARLARPECSPAPTQARLARPECSPAPWTRHLVASAWDPPEKSFGRQGRPKVIRRRRCGIPARRIQNPTIGSTNPDATRMSRPRKAPAVRLVANVMPPPCYFQTPGARMRT